MEDIVCLQIEDLILISRTSEMKIVPYLYMQSLLQHAACCCSKSQWSSSLGCRITPPLFPKLRWLLLGTCRITVAYPCLVIVIVHSFWGSKCRSLIGLRVRNNWCLVTSFDRSSWSACMLCKLTTLRNINWRQEQSKTRSDYKATQLCLWRL